jgi:hypothetical protein
LIVAECVLCGGLRLLDGLLCGERKGRDEK